MKVQLNARNRAYEFEAEPGEKILFAGLRARVDLPYECGTGTCGTCRTKLLAGVADHRDLVLAEHEKADTIMICVSRARSPELVIDR